MPHRMYHGECEDVTVGTVAGSSDALAWLMASIPRPIDINWVDYHAFPQHLFHGKSVYADPKELQQLAKDYTQRSR
jgi:hypothetical protein